MILERNHFRAEQEAGAQLLPAWLEERLEQALRDEDALRRTDVPDAFVEVRDKPGELSPGQCFDGHDCAVLHELLVGFLPDDLLDADAPEDLHGPLADLRRARMNGRAAMMLNGERANAVVAEQQRRGHAHKAA